jgi:cell wall-associated NlpC family hydrolase
MMRSVWISGALLIALGGCSTHTPLHTPVSKPLLKPMTSDVNQSGLDDPFCCMLPQDLEIKLPEYGPKVNDTERFEQSLNRYAEINGVDSESLLEIQTTFEGRYYSPWNYVAPPQKLSEIMWPMRAYRGGFGSNLRPLPPVWFEEIKNLSNYEAYGSLNKKGITLRWMDIRAFPTEKPLYKDPSIPGEGYPFDLLQNSSVNYNEPVFISHMSKDGAWSYIFTNNASGWVRSDGISLIDDTTAVSIQKSKKLFLMEDNLPIYDGENRFVAYGRIGMVLPLEREEGETYYVKGIGANNSDMTLSVPKKSAYIGVRPFNKDDLIRLGNQLMKNTYGWGGMYGERDCSSMIRDYMTPMGIWLPRNSAAQARKGEVISFSGMSNDEKLALIKEKGVPFETIIYLKGHVLLYIGTYQESVMVMHNLWGIRTIDQNGRKGRHIVGKALISTLELGSELETFDPTMKLLSRVESMNIFTKIPLSLSRENKTVPKKKSL